MSAEAGTPNPMPMPTAGVAQGVRLVRGNPPVDLVLALSGYKCTFTELQWNAAPCAALPSSMSVEELLVGVASAVFVCTASARTGIKYNAGDHSDAVEMMLKKLLAFCGFPVQSPDGAPPRDTEFFRFVYHLQEPKPLGATSSTVSNITIWIQNFRSQYTTLMPDNKAN